MQAFSTNTSVSRLHINPIKLLHHRARYCNSSSYTHVQHRLGHARHRTRGHYIKASKYDILIHHRPNLTNVYPMATLQSFGFATKSHSKVNANTDDEKSNSPPVKKAKLDSNTNESSTQGDLDSFEDRLFDGSTRPQDTVKPFLDGLIPYVNDTAKHKDILYHEDKACIVVWDIYAKAQCHMLVIPKRVIDEAKHLTKADLPLVQHLHNRARWVIGKMKDDPKFKDIEFRAGIHAIPSVRQLHIHVISQDFHAERMKNKKHWNSFTTDYFVDMEKVLQMLKDKGGVKVDKDKMLALLKQDMKCHVCHEPQRNIPILKKHIATHLPASMASAL